MKKLLNPVNQSRASVPDIGTASPMVGPDGDVYFGVLTSDSDFRGFMLHFSGDLSKTKTPGSFGWDDTASVVPASMVSSYHGTSKYLIMTKYNNYADGGGDGVNKLAILDPNATQTDPLNKIPVMKEVSPRRSHPRSEFPYTPVCGENGASTPPVKLIRPPISDPGQQRRRHAVSLGFSDQHLHPENRAGWRLSRFIPILTARMERSIPSINRRCLRRGHRKLSFVDPHLLNCCQTMPSNARQMF